MRFEDAYSFFLNDHMSARKGESRRRLEEAGLGHAEKLFLEAVWWPAFGNFHYLHPEYELSDYKDGYRYLDFAYIRKHVRLAIEIDGFGTHWRNISRSQFTDHNRRQNDLVIDGWKVLRFTYDDIKDSPRFCQQKMHQFMGRWLGEERRVSEATWTEKEIIRIIMKSGRPVTPKIICEEMKVEAKTARRWLRGLTDKGWLLPESGEKRIRAYRLNLDGKDFDL